MNLFLDTCLEENYSVLRSVAEVEEKYKRMISLQQKRCKNCFQLWESCLLKWFVIQTIANRKACGDGQYTLGRQMLS